MHPSAQLTFSILYSSESPAEETVLPIVKIGFPTAIETIKVILHRHVQRLLSQVILAPIKLRFNTMTPPARNASELKAAPITTLALLVSPFFIGVFISLQ